MYIHVCVCVCVCVCVDRCVCVHLDKYIYMCVCVCVCVLTCECVRQFLVIYFPQFLLKPFAAHPSFNSLTTTQINTELTVSRDYVRSTFGVNSRFFRPPFGHIDARARTILASMGMATVLWDIDVEDWRHGPGGDPNKLQLAAFKRQLDNGGNLVVAHYLYQSTVDQFDEMITYAKSKGRRFVRLDQCISGFADTPWSTTTVRTTTTPTTTRTTTRTTSFSTVGGSGPYAIPVLGYHQMNTASFYSVTTTNFTAQMNLLKTLGYSAVSPQQYVRWLQGNNSGLPAKPVFITFDDNIANANAATSVLTSLGLRATMYSVSGFADNPDGWNMDWAQLTALRSSGVWDIQLHAGPQGHYQITTQACVNFYACRLTGETSAAYQTRVINDLTAGENALISRGLMSGPSITFATPWDDWGQTSSDTVPSSWFPGYLASRFAVVLQQDYGYGSGGFDRRYRFEIHSDTTLAAFEAALSNTRFTRSG
jgi:peptidoglycan/xylan/chitin deacetylase (PgdA/CDA1 family)